MPGNSGYVAVLAAALLWGGDAVDGIAQERSFSFERDDLTLRGILHVPGMADGPLPAVVLVHGSGPNSAEHTVSGQLVLSFGFGLDVFTEIGEALADAGFAVLRYDKRTCGPFNGCGQNDYPMPSSSMTVDDFVLDALAGLEALAREPSIDESRLFVVGLSQGGTLVPTLLQRDARLVTGVMLATPHSPPDLLVAYQRELADSLLSTIGSDTATAASVLGSIDRLVASFRKVRDGGSPDLGPGVTAGFLRSWLELADSAPPVAASLSTPILVLSGEMDWHVPPSETALWEHALSGSRERIGHEFVVLPCVTHALNCISENDPRAIRSEHIGRHVSKDVLDRVIAFLQRNAE